MTRELNEIARNMADLDRLVHEPARLVILTILYTLESADFLYLQREASLTKGNLSSHLSKLEEAGYIEIQKTYQGKMPLTICRLTEAGRKAFEAYREQIKQFLEGI
jgi:DNA-binding MarR family transcriptional regulator